MAYLFFGFGVLWAENKNKACILLKPLEQKKKKKKKKKNNNKKKKQLSKLVLSENKKNL